jgi:hypothetical protein
MVDILRLVPTRVEEATAKPADEPPTYVEARSEFAKRFMVDKGLEVCALNWPLEAGPYAQDFIIANHFPKHTEGPIGTIGNHLSNSPQQAETNSAAIRQSPAQRAMAAFKGARRRQP